MNVFEGSSVCRAARRVVPWITRLARDSLTGRAVLAGAAAVGWACADSRILGRVPPPRPLALDDRSASVAALAWPYLGLKKKVASACAGRHARAHGRYRLSFCRGYVGAGHGARAFSPWGAGLAASGPASSGSRLAVSICLLALGVLTIGIGPRLVSGAEGQRPTGPDLSGAWRNGRRSRES